MLRRMQYATQQAALVCQTSVRDARLDRTTGIQHSSLACVQLPSVGSLIYRSCRLRHRKLLVNCRHCCCCNKRASPSTAPKAPQQPEMQQQHGVLLRIKRRRDQQAPEQLVLEATSRTSALFTDFQRLLGIGGSIQRSQDTTGPPRKRCRFVLLKQECKEGGTEQQQQQQLSVGHAAQHSAAAAAPDAAPRGTAAAAAAPAGKRVLDLWHSSGVSSRSICGRAELTHSIPTQQQQQQQQQQGQQVLPGGQTAAAEAAVAGSTNPHHAGDLPQNGMSGKGIMYEHMVHEYLEQQQQQQQQQQAGPAGTPPAAVADGDAAVGASRQQQRKPPSRRAARFHAHPAAAPVDACQPQPQQQQQQAEDLQQHDPSQQQQQSPGLPEYMTREMLHQYGLSAQAAQGAAAAGYGSSSVVIDDSDDPEYVYDMYIPVYDDVMMTDADGTDNIREQEQDGTTVVKLWEEDLADFEDLWPVHAGTAAAAAGDETEDSNAEDYYANSYPDEDHSYQHSDDTDNSQNPEAYNSDNEQNPNDSFEGVQTHGITCYKPKSNNLKSSSAGVNDDVGTEEYDVDEYESSGDEEQLQGYYNSGAAWRAVLAEQCGLLEDGDDM